MVAILSRFWLYALRLDGNPDLTGNKPTRACVCVSHVQALVRSSPEMASQPEFQALSNLRGVDVVAVRMFFKERLDMPRAASVAGGGMAPGKT